VARFLFGFAAGAAAAYLVATHPERLADARRRLAAVVGPTELHELTRDELYERAQAAGIAGRSGMTKDELAEALEGGAGETSGT
jgi:hypothetical protein